MTDQDLKLCQHLVEASPTPVALISFGSEGLCLCQ
jgi:hypothetical protein